MEHKIRNKWILLILYCNKISYNNDFIQIKNISCVVKNSILHVQYIFLSYQIFFFIVHIYIYVYIVKTRLNKKNICRKQNLTIFIFSIIVVTKLIPTYAE